MTKLTATIEPNNRKYYGTEIKLTTEDGREASFSVWINGISDYTPSEREYDFKDDEGRCMVRDGDDAYEYEICDDHYETQTAFNICKKIIEAIDGMEIT